MSEARQAQWWTCDAGAERISNCEIGDAVLEWWDGLSPDEPLPETVTVYGFAPRVIDDRERERLAMQVMDDLHESLEDEYGDPDGLADATITDSMKQAARAFVAAVLNEYSIWQCEKVCEETVTVKDYIP